MVRFTDFYVIRMEMINVRRYYSALVVLFGLILIGCASTAPLPENINIVPPSQDLPPEIAAFSGIWKGKWQGYQETILIVESIDIKKARVIISFGLAGGYEPRYYHRTARVVDGPAIILDFFNEDQQIFKMDKDLTKIHGTFIQKKTGARMQLELYKQDKI